MLVPDQDHRVDAKPAGDIVARSRDFALVPDELPGAGEDPAQLLLVDVRVEVQAAGYPELSGLVDETHRSAP